jgi:hypothetical protein
MNDGSAKVLSEGQKKKNIFRSGAKIISIHEKEFCFFRRSYRSPAARSKRIATETDVGPFQPLVRSFASGKGPDSGPAYC